MKTKDYFLFFLASCFLVIALIFIFETSLKRYDQYLSGKSTNIIDLNNPRHVFARDILTEVLRANNRDPKKISLKILSGEANGKVLAESHLGRVINISDNLLDNIKTKQGLAFVLAHEIAHIELGHLCNIESFYLSKNIGEFGISHYQKFNYKQEFEADGLAVALLKRTYEELDAKDVIEVFMLIDTANEYLIKNNPKFKRRFETHMNYTHPSDAVRIAVIKKLIEKQK